MTKDTKNGSKLYFRILKTWKNWEWTRITSIPFPLLRTSFPIPSGQIPVPATQIPFSQSKNRSIPVPILPLQDPQHTNDSLVFSLFKSLYEMQSRESCRYISHSIDINMSSTIINKGTEILFIKFRTINKANKCDKKVFAGILENLQPGFLDSSKYFTSTNSKNFLGNSFLFKIYYTSLNVPKKKLRTLTPEKITLKLLYVLETCFVLNFKYR